MFRHNLPVPFLLYIFRYIRSWVFLITFTISITNFNFILFKVIIRSSFTYFLSGFVRYFYQFFCFSDFLGLLLIYKGLQITVPVDGNFNLQEPLPKNVSTANITLYLCFRFNFRFFRSFNIFSGCQVVAPSPPCEGEGVDPPLDIFLKFFFS